MTRYPDEARRVLWLDRPVERLTLSSADDKRAIEEGGRGELRDLLEGVFMFDVVSIRPGMFSFHFMDKVKFNLREKKAES